MPIVRIETHGLMHTSRRESSGITSGHLTFNFNNFLRKMSMTSINEAVKAQTQNAQPVESLEVLHEPSHSHRLRYQRLRDLLAVVGNT